MFYANIVILCSEDEEKKVVSGMIVEQFTCFSNLRKFLAYCEINPEIILSLIRKGCRISPMAIAAQQDLFTGYTCINPQA